MEVGNKNGLFGLPDLTDNDAPGDIFNQPGICLGEPPGAAQLFPEGANRLTHSSISGRPE